MQVIYKFPLKLTEFQELRLPNVHHFLHVGQQNGELMLWVQLYKEHPYDVVEKIWIYGTGHDIPNADVLVHLGTVQVGAFVWHVFTQTGIG